MKKTRTAISFDQMCWPRVGGFTEDFLWRLKYGHTSNQDLHLAASFISAYIALVYKTQKDRNKICHKLREAEIVRPNRKQS